MFQINKIFFLVLGVSYLTLASVCLYAREKPKQKKINNNRGITIGFNSGKTLTYTGVASFRNDKKNGSTLFSTHSLSITKQINNYFKVETRLNYNTQNTLSPSIGLGNKYAHYSLSIPTTIQYYFLPNNKKHTFHPYCGAGLQYNFEPNTHAIANNKELLNTGSVPQPGTRYVSILFTQGVTYEVNTKIDVNESIHFIPGSDNNAIGIDIGIGYHLP